MGIIQLFMNGGPMKNKKSLLIITICCLVFLCSCGKKQDNLSVSIDNSQIMEGMNTLYSENTQGYAFGIDTKPSFGVDEDGIFELSSDKDFMYFSVESAGEKQRQFAVQIFIDYIQTPIIIDGTTYETFYINANEHFSKEYKFQFAKEIDTSKNHKILAILTAYSDIFMAKQDAAAVVSSTDTSLCFDGILSFDVNNSLASSIYQINDAKEYYTDNFSGLLLNTEPKNIRRIPSNTIQACPKENINLSYHIGTTYTQENIEDELILVNISNQQTKLNEQAYYYVKTVPGKIAYGNFSIVAPQETGLYEITAWSVPDPFNENINNCNINIPMAMRFTLSVE